MVGPWSLHLVDAADKVSHLGSAICFRPKKGRVEKLGHSYLEHKGSFKVEISGTRPPS